MKTCDLQFCKLLESTCVDSLPIAAGGSHAKRRLSFKAGVFVDIEPLRLFAVPLGTKMKTQGPEFENSF